MNNKLLQLYANTADCVSLSVGYRLAPEDQWPKGLEDYIDTGEHLVKNAKSVYRAPLRFIGRESAGANLSVITAFYLLKAHSSFYLSGGLFFYFGCYDLSVAPSATHFKRNLILNNALMYHYVRAYLLEHTLDQRKTGAILLFFEDFAPFRGRLPGVLFTVGTEDALVDNTMNMAIKWLMFGGEAIVKVYPGAYYGFILISPYLLKEVGEALEDTKTYIKDRLVA